MRNEGVSTTGACQLLYGTDGVHPDWQTQMILTPASIVIVNHGINDWNITLTAYRDCLRGLAQIAKTQGKRVIFETPNPTAQTPLSALQDRVATMKQVAQEEQIAVIDQHTYLTNLLGGQSIYTMVPDGLHPSDAVYILKGQYAASVFPTLTP